MEIHFKIIQLFTLLCILDKVQGFTPKFDNFQIYKNDSNFDEFERDLIIRTLAPFYFHDYLKNTEINSNISDLCSEDLKAWQTGIFQLKTWALHMVDSWGKIPDGILSGHVLNFGDFDECTEAFADFSNSTSFYGQYCSVSFFPAGFIDELTANQRRALSIEDFIKMIANIYASPSMIPTTAICVPSSCSQEDVFFYLQNVFGNLTVLITPAPVSCVKGGERDLTNGAIVMIVILSILGSICILSTILDLFINRENNTSNEKKSAHDTSVENSKPKPKHSKIMQFLLSFSLYTNTIRFLSSAGGSDNLGCIHGIRFLSMCWVVLCHTWAMIISEASIWNLVDAKQMYKSSWTMNTILNGTVSVDTFFMLSGLLVAYNLLKMLDKTKGKFNVLMFYLHRYLRLTPMYALIIGFIATLFPYMANGPRHHLLEFNADVCRRHWWHNLLYINNLIKYGEDDEKCEVESWYISNDMQFFIFSPLLIYPLWRWRRIGIALTVLATIASIATPSIIIAVNELIPTTLTHPAGRPIEKTMDFVDKLYIKPWTRAGPYIVGIWFGFFLYLLKDRREFRIRLPFAIIGWILSTGTALSILYAPWKWNDPENVIGETEAWIFGGLHRSLWGLVIGWVIFACMKGRGWLVNRFLSWSAFVPLGRLTFSTYLVSFPIQIIMSVIKGRTASYYSPFVFTTNFFAELTLSLMVAFICTITMESPFMQIEKLIFGQ